MAFHHLGLAVREPERASRFLRGLGYQVGDVVHDPLQQVQLIWCERPDMPAVELIFPSDGPGPLDAILSERSEMIYHLCYESEGALASVEAIKQSGQRVVCVSPPKPAILFGGRPVSFYVIRGFGLIEILERAAR